MLTETSQHASGGNAVTTAYQLDPNGNCLAQTDGNDHVTTFEYNVRNLPVRRIDHGGRMGTQGVYTYDAAKTESYAYDAAGRMITRTDRMGTETVWTYDARGRILTETVGDDAVSRKWDDNGNLLTLTDATGITTYTYDALNRLLTKQDPLVGILSYVYDRTASLPAGHVGERMTDAAGHITDTVYDSMGRISHVISGTGSGTHSATYAYTDTGLRESLVYDSGVREDYTYTVDGLLESLINRKGDGTGIDSYAYTYDAARNQTGKTDGKGTTTYTYDNLNRLLTVSEPNGRATAYTFDAAGNRLTETVTQGSTTTVKTSSYNEQNRLTILEIHTNGIM